MPARPSPNSNIVCVSLDPMVGNTQVILSDLLAALEARAEIQNVQQLGGNNNVYDTGGSLIQVKLKLTKAPASPQAAVRDAATAVLLATAGAENCDPVICPPQELSSDLDDTAGIVTDIDWTQYDDLSPEQAFQGVNNDEGTSLNPQIVAQGGQLAGFYLWDAVVSGAPGSFVGSTPDTVVPIAYNDTGVVVPSPLVIRVKIDVPHLVGSDDFLGGGPATPDAILDGEDYPAQPVFKINAGDTITLNFAGGGFRVFTFQQTWRFERDRGRNHTSGDENGNSVSLRMDFFATQEGTLYLQRTPGYIAGQSGFPGFKIVGSASGTVSERNRRGEAVVATFRNDYATACQYAPA